MAYLKPQSPIKLGEDHIYPLTTIDQVVMDNGKRLSGVGVYLEKPEESDDTNLETGVNADTLGGILPSEFTLKSEFNEYKNTLEADICENYVSKSDVPVTSVNGMTGDIKITELHRIIFPFHSSGWTEQDDGRFTQLSELSGITSETRACSIDIDMSNATVDNISDLRDAWSVIDIAETVDGGILLTAFDGAPEIDFNVIVEVLL